jgi:hypothetical protein
MAGEWWLPHHCRVAEWSTTYLPQYKSYVICHRGSLASGQMTRARGNKERVNSCAPLLIPGWMQMHLRCNSLRIYRLLSSKMMVFWRALHWKPHRNTSISILLVARSEDLNSDPLSNYFDALRSEIIQYPLTTEEEYASTTPINRPL